LAFLQAGIEDSGSRGAFGACLRYVSSQDSGNEVHFSESIDRGGIDRGANGLKYATAVRSALAMEVRMTGGMFLRTEVRSAEVHY